MKRLPYVLCFPPKSAYSAYSDKVLIQPFLSTILSEGEWSLIMIDGTYSHTGISQPSITILMDIYSGYFLN